MLKIQHHIFFSVPYLSKIWALSFLYQQQCFELILDNFSMILGNHYKTIKIHGFRLWKKRSKFFFNPDSPDSWRLCSSNYVSSWLWEVISIKMYVMFKMKGQFLVKGDLTHPIVPAMQKLGHCNLHDGNVPL